MTRFLALILLTLLTLFLYNCSSEVDYGTLVKQGLNSGVKQDSLFLGYHFGMNIEEFHSSSWELNKQGIITGDTKVQYELKNLKSDALMTFYPTFYESVIIRMPVEINYKGWAPWNEQYAPGELIKDLINYYEEIYDAEFTYLYIPQIDEYAYININGNREIRLYQNSPSTVMVEFIDLSVYKIQS